MYRGGTAAMPDVAFVGLTLLSLGACYLLGEFLWRV
jgi:hypothetical protein